MFDGTEEQNDSLSSSLDDEEVTVSRPRMPAAEAEQLLVAHQAHLERMVSTHTKRYGLNSEESLDALSHVQLKLVEDRYGRLRSFSGRSKFTTFLRVVVTNLLRDYFNHLWGKYRASKAALRLGHPAIVLDQLIRRDGRTEAEALETVMARPDNEHSEAQLEDLVRQLPQRSQRRTETGQEELLLHLPATADAAQPFSDDEELRQAEPVVGALRSAVAELAGDDRLLINLRYFEGLSVAQIARQLETKQMPLYRRFESLLRKLRKQLIDAGLSANEVRELLRSDELPDVPEDSSSPQNSDGVRPVGKESKE